MKCLAALLLVATTAAAQAPGKWPPDSLVNTQVIPRTTPVVRVWGQMRDIAFGLGVECTFCHVGTEGAPLANIDFVSDQKRTKQVARQMLRMVQEINRRLDTIPARPSPTLQVNCASCHRGVPRPVPLADIVTQTALATDADSAIQVYRQIRNKYFGQDTYDFSEPTLSIAAFTLGRQGKFDDAFKLLALNESLFPNASGLYVIQGNIHLMRQDTSAAEASFRKAIQRDSTNSEARGRLRAIGRQH